MRLANSHLPPLHALARKLVLCLLSTGMIGQAPVKAVGRPAEDAVPDADYRNATYVIEGVPIKLDDGASQIEAAPGSAARITTRYFGQEIRKDLDGDGREDVAFLVTQEAGGSGTFFYLVAALKTERGYVGSQGFLLGDRIVPENVVSGPGRSITVHYADRAPGMGFATPASVGKTVRLELDPGTRRFVTVAQDEKHGAEPPRRLLRQWIWLRTIDREGAVTTPRQEGKFTLTFAGNGTFAATTDCNALGGNYRVGKKMLSFGPVAATQMHCEGSQERDFQDLLAQARGYHFASDGKLVLELAAKRGTAEFR